MEHRTQKNRSNGNYIGLFWSLVSPGLGHIYLGRWILGLIFLFLDLFMLRDTKLNITIYSALMGNFQKSNEIFMKTPVILYPSVYSFVMWHTFNHDIIAQKGSPKLTGFFVGLVIGGVPGLSYKFLGAHIFTGLAVGIATGVLFHLIETLILFIKRRKDS